MAIECAGPETGSITIQGAHGLTQRHIRRYTRTRQTRGRKRLPMHCTASLHHTHASLTHAHVSCASKRADLRRYVIHTVWIIP